MNSSVKKSILLLSLVVFASALILFSPDTSSAQTIYYTTECGEQFSIGSCSNVYCSTCCDEYSCWPCCPCCTECSCSGSWKEYKANSAGCEPDVLARECRSVCGPASACCSCGPCQVECDAWETCEDCGSWQKAERSCEVTKAGLVKPESKCNKDCIDKPINPRYYDNSNYPTNTCSPETGKASNNIYLPVKLDWDDARGWKDGWGNGVPCPHQCSASCPECPAPQECYEEPECVKSYVIRITGEMRECETMQDVGSYEKVLDKSEFIPCSCMFKSNRTYEWQVRACCPANGSSNCGPWSDVWRFTTNAAPEPILPPDPDWQGPEKTEDYPLPALLSWCEMPLAQSYYLQAYKNGDLHLPWPITKKDGELLPQYFDEPYNFTTETIYQWEVAACLNEDVTRCGPDCRDDQSPAECAIFSQRWIFLTEEMPLLPPERESPAYDPTKPTEILAINQLNSLKWKSVLEAHFYRYQIKKGGEIVVDEAIEALEGLEVKFNQIDPLWDSIEKLDQVYSWRVASCWGKEENQCGELSEPPWFFQTTGARPTNLSEDVKIIPVKLDWDDMPGAASYSYEVADDSGFTNIVISEDQRVVENKSEVLVDYPCLKQNTTYWWRVKTCADKEGEVCGKWSDVRSFTTFTLAEPIPSRPEDREEFYTYERYLRWNEVDGARAYQYRVYYGAAEKIGLTKVLSNYALVDTPRQLELGEHAWEVRACLDKNCEEVGSFGGPWRFEVVEKVPPGEGGLVPCSRDVNVPDPYDIDETEPCEFKHLFLLLRNILDFALWRLGLIILALLAVATGAIFYFSMGAPSTIVNVKSLWKAAGMGYLIIFLAYTVINTFLAILGYKIGVLGPWWVISF